MPRTKQAGKEPANKQKGKKRCTCCHEEKTLSTGFYLSKSPLFSIDERVPICKVCVINSSLNQDGTINEIEFNKILRQIDKPYYKNLIVSAQNQFKKEHSYVADEEIKYHGKELLQIYFKLIAMRQDREKSYADSEKEGFMHQNNNMTLKEKRVIADSISDIDTSKTKNVNDEIISNESEKFEVTDEMINLFGEGYTRIEYKNMFRKYNDMKINYSIQTNLHQEALVTYVRFKVKEELATAKGDVADAQKWYAAAQDAADKAKLTPKQLTQADLQGGINSFSEIFKAVEQAVDVIPILPKFKFRPNDALDFNIWCYINYARDLQGLPQCQYEDVYKFYDKKKEEYISQYGDPYGIFDEDPTEVNRPNIKKFITLPKDYEDGDDE